MRKAKYPVEAAAEKLLLESANGVRRMTEFFFVVPKKKMDKYIYIMETVSWLMLGIALVLRLVGR